MTKSEIVSRVSALVSTQLDIPVDELTLSSSFVDDLDLDSLGVIELVLAVEEEFDLEIPSEDEEKLATIEDLVDYLDSRLDPPKAGAGAGAGAGKRNGKETQTNA